VHDCKEDESSRTVKMTSRRSSEIVKTWTGVDSRNLIKWFLHGSLFRSSTSLGLQRCIHFCLLCRLLIRFWTKCSTVSTEMESLGGWDCRIPEEPVILGGLFIDEEYNCVWYQLDVIIYIIIMQTRNCLYLKGTWSARKAEGRGVEEALKTTSNWCSWFRRGRGVKYWSSLRFLSLFSMTNLTDRHPVKRFSEEWVR